MPEPSRLVLLDQLQTLPSGAKIRFLACVHSYNSQKALLILRDKYPATTSLVPTASVKVNNVLETVNHELLEVGSWLNVIGYMRRPSSLNPSKVSIEAQSQAQPSFIEATTIWSAGAIKLDKYKTATQGYQKLATDE